MKPNHPPLKGIKVLDLSRILPGPFCTMLLADLGCEVTHVGMPKMVDPMLAWFPPGPAREFLASSIYRGKKSIVVNFKRKEGRDIVLKLAKESDVVVEGFRAGALAKSGLGYAEISKVNPRAIYCSISGYGQTGPYRRWGSHDINYLSFSGFLSLWVEANHNVPRIPPLPIGDIGGGSLYAVTSILAALYEREKSGKGQYLDVSILDGIWSWMILPYAWHLADSPRNRPIFGGDDPFYSIYPTADNRYIALGAVEPGYRQRVLQLLGRGDLEKWIFDTSQWELVRGELSKVFKSRPLKEWRDLLEPNETCASGVLTFNEAIANEQLLARKRIGRAKQSNDFSWITHPFVFSRSRSGAQPKPYIVGKDTQEILSGLGFSSSQLKELQTKRVVL